MDDEGASRRVREDGEQVDVACHKDRGVALKDRVKSPKSTETSSSRGQGHVNGLGRA